MLRQRHVQLANDQIFDHGVEVRLGREVPRSARVRPKQRFELLRWGFRSEIAIIIIYRVYLFTYDDKLYNFNFFEFLKFI